MENEFQIKFERQGNTWTATLQKPNGTAGFGETPEEALKDLFLEKDKDNYQKSVDDPQGGKKE